MYEDIEHLKLERRGHAMWVILDNGTQNRMTAGMNRELSYVFRDISRDPDVHVAVLTSSAEGEGGNFCAGGDLTEIDMIMADKGKWLPELLRRNRETVLNILDCDKPTIARINGNAIGLGASIALACDFTIIRDTAKIGDTHNKIGLVTNDGGAMLWPHLVGWMQAKRWLLTGDLMSGKEAERIGLVTFSADAEHYDELVDSWVERFANGPLSSMYNKRALNMTIRSQATTYMDTHQGMGMIALMSDDHREAMDAFFNKRKPEFKWR